MSTTQIVISEQIAKQIQQIREQAYELGSNQGEKDAIRKAITGLNSDQLVDFIFRHAGASMADVSNFCYQRLFTIRQKLLKESLPQDVIDKIFRVGSTPNGHDLIKWWSSRCGLRRRIFPELKVQTYA